VLGLGFLGALGIERVIAARGRRTAPGRAG
jgi:hypothetical protein